MKTVPIAKALVLDSENNMLVLRRSQTHPTLAGHRDLPGGLLEEGEEPGEALSREILEETGLKLAPSDLQLVYAGTEISGTQSRVRLFYVTRLAGKAPKIIVSWEHDTPQWLELAELEHIENEFHSFYHDALHHVRANKLLPN